MSDTKKYTLTEVAQHKTKDDLWFVIHGKVYDVTKFGDDHPGGGQALVDEAGMLLYLNAKICVRVLWGL